MFTVASIGGGSSDVGGAFLDHRHRLALLGLAGGVNCSSAVTFYQGGRDGRVKCVHMYVE